MSKFHVVYRSYGPSNKKSRPPYFSKLLALASLVRSAEEAGSRVNLVFLNDGPIPKEILSLMETAGEVVNYERLGFSGSYKEGFSFPIQRDWDDDDFVWFSEDDYLYKPNAIPRLIAAVERLPFSDYLALYGAIGDRGPEGGPLPSYAPAPKGWSDEPVVDVDGHKWRRGLSTTSTFGARVRAIREDQRVIVWPLAAGKTGLDHAVCLMYQRQTPYTWSSLAKDLFFASAAPNFNIRVKRFFAAPIRGAFNLATYMRPDYKRQLFTADPPLATHLEDGMLGYGSDWKLEAESCAKWAAKRGIKIDLG
ncbi:MAG: hypothetical protein AAF719_02845 [Pseudomonadota bacterium]